MFQHEVSNKKSTNVRIFFIRAFNKLLSRVSPKLAAILAERIFVTPISTRRPARETSWARNAERITLASPLGGIPVWLWGEGPETVILVHGWSGRGLQLGAFVAPLIERGYRVVAFDAPAHGEAPGHASSMPAFAAALGAVGRQFGPVAAVIAHSLGCTASIYALAHHEIEAERVIVISPSARLHAVRERFGEMAGFSPAVLDRMREAFEKRFAFDWEASEPLRIARQLSIPALVIHDAEDRFIPHHEGAELSHAWPESRLVTTTNLGHHRILRDPEVIATAVEFVAESTPQILIERRAS